MKKILQLLLIISTLLILLSVAYAQDEGNPHDFEAERCLYCHINIPGEGGVIKKLTFRKDISELCLECHVPKEAVISHCVGVIPSMKVPEDLHLDINGKLTCATCHNPHLDHQDKKSEYKTYFLRRGNLKRELCLACHYEQGFQEVKTLPIKIITPLDNIIITNNRLPLIGIVKKSKIKEIGITVNGALVKTKVVMKSFNTILGLQEGMNNIEVSFDGQKGITLNLYYTFHPTEGYRDRLFYSHIKIGKGECKKCHKDISGNGYKIRGKDINLCYECHQRKDTAKYIHGPIGGGACIICHDPHGQTDPNFLVKKGKDLCFMCHDEELTVKHLLGERKADSKLWSKKNCLFCHDPHGTEEKFQLRVKTEA